LITLEMLHILMAIEGFTMRGGVKERKGVNETPRRGGSVVVCFS